VLIFAMPVLKITLESLTNLCSLVSPCVPLDFWYFGCFMYKFICVELWIVPIDPVYSQRQGQGEAREVVGGPFSSP